VAGLPDADAPTSGAVPLDAVVVPGVPGHGAEFGPKTYPAETSDFIKVMRECGLRVDYADRNRPRQRVAQKSIEVWLPQLLFTTVGTGAGNLLSQAIVMFIGTNRLAKAEAHARWGRRLMPDGTREEWFEFDGPGDELIEWAKEILNGGRPTRLRH